MFPRGEDERVELGASVGVIAVIATVVAAVWWASSPAGERTQPGAARSAGAAPADRVPLPWMSGIRRGTLENGLTYLVLANDNPAQRAQLRLQVAAGSVHETDDQRGLAHFVEHMAFNGTAKYDKQAIIDYLERVGMRFGPDTNASTGFDRTVYMLKVPTDDPETVSKGLDFLHQWAGAIQFEEQAVRDERGVVLEEWRQNRGPAQRSLEDLLPALFRDSLYAERLPIGTPESIQTATRERLLEYYRDWYRPQRMTVVAVGDFDAADMESQIREVFSDLRSPPDAPERVDVEIPAHGETEIVISEDEELSDTSILLYDVLPRRPSRTFGDERRVLHAMTGVLALNFRYQELIQAESSPPLKEAGVLPRSDLAEPIEPVMYAGTVAGGRLREALEILLAERRRAVLHGFTESEVEKIRPMFKAIMSSEAAGEADKTSGELADELAYAALRDAPHSSAAELEESYAQMIDAMTAADVSAAYAEYFAGDTLALQVNLPADEAAPSVDGLREIVTTVARAELSSWGGDGETKPLMATSPQPGEIVAESRGPYDVLEWRLSNGARVLIKQTDFESDEILFRATSPGGRSRVDDADLAGVKVATEVFAQVGLGDLDRIELRDTLLGAVASVRPWTDREAEYLDGATRPEDLETLLKMVHLAMTDLRPDRVAFDRWKRHRAEELENAAQLPSWNFAQEARHERFDLHPRMAPMTADRIRRLTLEQIRRLYRRRFGDAGDFDFVFVGDVEPETLEPLVETYLASLPATGVRETPQDRDVGFARGRKRWVGEVNVEPKTEVAIRYHIDAPWSRELEHDLALVGDVLRIRLRERLREDESGTYSVHVGAAHYDPDPFAALEVSFSCDPNRADELLGALEAELAKLRAEGPSDAELDKVREMWAAEHEEAVEKNDYWRRILGRAYRRDEPAELHHELAPRLERVTAAGFGAALERFLDSGNRQLTMTVPTPDRDAAERAPRR